MFRCFEIFFESFNIDELLIVIALSVSPTIFYFFKQYETKLPLKSLSISKPNSVPVIFLGIYPFLGILISFFFIILILFEPLPFIGFSIRGYLNSSTL